MTHDIKYKSSSGGAIIESIDGIELNEIVSVDFSELRPPIKAEILGFALRMGLPWVQVRYLETERESEAVRFDRIKRAVDTPDEWEFTAGAEKEANEDPILDMNVGFRNIKYKVSITYNVTDEITISIPVPDYLDAEGGKGMAYKAAYANLADIILKAVETSRSAPSVVVEHVKV